MCTVPPVYYAHLASARARAHEIGGAEKDKERALQEAEAAATTPSGSKPTREPVPITEDIRPLGMHLQDKMWYI